LVALRGARLESVYVRQVRVDTQELLDRHAVALDLPTGSVDRDIAQQLAIGCHEDAHSVVLVLRGEVDLAAVTQLEHALVDAVSRGRSRIVIDLAEVQFIDSMGLATLFHAQRQADANGHSLILRDIPHQAKQLFELAGVDGAFVAD
jgi:anti-sigma B factor antagonist